MVQAKEGKEAGDAGAWLTGENYMHQIYGEKVARTHITGHSKFNARGLKGSAGNKK